MLLCRQQDPLPSACVKGLSSCAVPLQHSRSRLSDAIWPALRTASLSGSAWTARQAAIAAPTPCPAPGLLSRRPATHASEAGRTAHSEARGIVASKAATTLPACCAALDLLCMLADGCTAGWGTPSGFSVEPLTPQAEALTRGHGSGAPGRLPRQHPPAARHWGCWKELPRGAAQGGARH